MRVPLVVFVGGCATCPSLDQVPIRSATPDQEAAGQAVLDELAADLVPPVCINHLTFGGVFRTATVAAVYDRFTHGVRVSRLEPLGRVDPDVRHEICHGVDLQNGVVKGREAQFPFPGDAPDAVRRSHLPNEAFADVCELGPAPLAILWDSSCPDDPDLRAVDLVRAEVWGFPADPPDAALRYEPVAEAEVGEGARIRVVESADHHLMIVEIGSYTVRILDPWTGADLPLEGALPPVEEPQEAEFPVGWYGRDFLWVDDRAELALAEGFVPGGEVRRLLARVDGDWAPVDGPCPIDGTQLLRFDGEVWSDQVEGGVLKWGRWTR